MSSKISLIPLLLLFVSQNCLGQDFEWIKHPKITEIVAKAMDANLRDKKNDFKWYESRFRKSQDIETGVFRLKDDRYDIKIELAYSIGGNYVKYPRRIYIEDQLVYSHRMPKKPPPPPEPDLMIIEVRNQGPRKVDVLIKNTTPHDVTADGIFAKFYLNGVKLGNAKRFHVEVDPFGAVRVVGNVDKSQQRAGSVKFEAKSENGLSVDWKPPEPEYVYFGPTVRKFDFKKHRDAHK